MRNPARPRFFGRNSDGHDCPSDRAAKLQADGKNHGTATTIETGIASKEASLSEMRQDDESLANALQNLSRPGGIGKVTASHRRIILAESSGPWVPRIIPDL
jgi:hypothetical protein